MEDSKFIPVSFLVSGFHSLAICLASPSPSTMHSLTLFLAILPMAVLCRSNTYLNRMQHAKHVRRSNGYTLKVKHQGNTFFDGWDFYTGPDPTHGNVQFLNANDAAAAGLAYVQADGTTVLAVDNKSQVPPGGQRKSVRIGTKDSYDNGLVIADFWAMPHGLSVWPAYWSVGNSWPNDGEIDIIEFVNQATTNQYTLHTGSGSDCTLDKAPQAIYKDSTGVLKPFLGNVMGTECRSSNGANAGCAFSDSGNASVGTAFNMGAGGVFALLWDNTQVSMWRFPRSSIPQDINAGNPDPTQWGIPMGYWSNSTCDIGNHFVNQHFILDITICGDWAGSAYDSLGLGSCTDAVANASNYDWAKWKINYVAMYGAT